MADTEHGKPEPTAEQASVTYDQARAIVWDTLEANRKLAPCPANTTAAAPRLPQGQFSQRRNTDTTIGLGPQQTHHILPFRHSREGKTNSKSRESA
jgi:hypothetical protein